MPKVDFNHKIGEDYKEKNYYLFELCNLMPDTKTIPGKKTIHFRKGRGGYTLIEICQDNYLIMPSKVSGIENNEVPDSMKHHIFNLRLINPEWIKTSVEINEETHFCKFLPKDNGYLNFFIDKSGNLIYDNDKGQELLNDILKKLK